ncbi:MAG: hypothetical protein SGI88_17960 [Candidatus Hydrogenedentes bacterium]|nr:hypothetical protein [Candidatus Hydrogenedentota bacterium]
MISGILSIIAAVFALIASLVLGIIVPVAIYFVLCAAWLFAIFGIPLLIVMVVVWLLGLPSARRARRNAPEEARVMQNVYRGLARMENRLNSLETLMLDRDSRFR